MIKFQLLLLLCISTLTLFSQTSIGLKRESIISEIKRSKPLVQFEQHKAYFVTSELMYNDFSSPRIQTGYYFDAAGICNKMIRMVPNQNLAAEISYYKRLTADKKFNLSHKGVEYAWQDDSRTITYIDPKTSNEFSYAIVIMPFRKEIEKYRLVNL